MKILIAAGGTGGHIYPGIAVAREIMRREPDSSVSFVGTARGLETRLVPQAGFPLELIESTGLVNMSLASRVRGLAVLPKSFAAARRVIRRVAPEVVVGAGGYVSGPVLLTASLMRVPTLIMESNAVPGFTNRTLSRFVDCAAVSFESSIPHFRGRAVFTGNPIRREFFSVSPKIRQPTSFTLLIFGGSQGARAINNAMVDALPYLEPFKGVLRIKHQTGEADFERIRDGYAAAGWSGQSDVRKYIEDMVTAFAETDLIVSRGGATTSAEVMAAGRVAIMVPLPGQIEQQRNAEALQNADAGRVIMQPALTGEKLATEIANFVRDPDRLTRMESKAKALGGEDAAGKVVDLIENLRNKRK